MDEQQYDPGNLVVVFAAVLPHMTVAVGGGRVPVQLVIRFRVRDSQAARMAFLRLLHRYDVDMASADAVLRDLSEWVRKAVEGGRPAETAQELDEDWMQGPLLADGLIAPVDPVEYMESLAKLQANMMEKAAKQKSVNGPLSTAEFFKQFFPGVAVDPEQAAAADAAIEAGMLSFHDPGLPHPGVYEIDQPTAADIAAWKEFVETDQAGPPKITPKLADLQRRLRRQAAADADNPCGLDPWPPPWL